MNENRITIGISSCLLGNAVRYDGQAKFHWYVNHVLNEYFEYLPICPEMEAGMGVPRNAVHLSGELKAPKMIDPKTSKDWTSTMQSTSKKILSSLDQIGGFIFKSKSPSCGLFRVKVHQSNGIPLKNGRGLFASALFDKYPLLPCEEEGRLNDAKLRENFIERIYAYDRLKNLLEQKFRRADWVNFHQNHKFQLLSHSRKHYKQLGQLVASISEYTPTKFKNNYADIFMKCLEIKTTIKKNTDVLFHIFGFMKKILSSEEKEQILEVINLFHQQVHPLIVPLTLLKYMIKIHNVDYIKDQSYLQPHPQELSLRNHV